MNLKQNIKVKFVSKKSQGAAELSNLKRFLPNNDPCLHNCEFLFSDEHDYDWLVVYDDFNYDIDCYCHKNNTLLITTEPSSIKVYESLYLKQFGHVLTGQENWAIKHSNKIYSQPALLWFYNDLMTYNEIEQSTPLSKEKLISTVCSSKKSHFTMHTKRYNFTKYMAQNLSELEWYGHGVKAIESNSEILDKFKYHITIENHQADHWWTEKIADAFLGCTLPFYFGPKNIFDYFPKYSLIPIDINDPKSSLKKITHAIETDQFEKRKEEILKARNLVLKKYNLFSTISKIIEERHHYTNRLDTPWEIHTRHNLRKIPHNRFSCIQDKVFGKLKSLIYSKL